MKSVLITGANRGIGLEFVKVLLKQPTPPEKIIATFRNKSNSEKLLDIAAKNKNVHALKLDVINFKKYREFVKQVEDIVGEDGLNVLINNAGVSSKFTRLGLVKLEQLSDTFMVNTVAPILLTKAYYFLLKKAAQKNESLPMGVSRAAVINISSVLGSIEKNNDGGFYPYRCSKAALNIATKSMSVDLKTDNILVVSMHPGWVKTDLGGHNAPLETHDAVQQIVHTMSTLTEDHNGVFIQYDGQILPW